MVRQERRQEAEILELDMADRDGRPRHRSSASPIPAVELGAEPLSEKTTGERRRVSTRSSKTSGRL